MLKAVPNKNAGFIILLTSIFTFFIFGEIRNLTALCLLNNNGFSLSSFFLCSLSFLWIGAQFPQEKFLSYGRILTLHYYFLLLCILLSLCNTGEVIFESPEYNFHFFLFLLQLYVSCILGSLQKCWCQEKFSHKLGINWFTTAWMLMNQLSLNNARIIFSREGKVLRVFSSCTGIQPSSRDSFPISSFLWPSF